MLQSLKITNLLRASRLTPLKGSFPKRDISSGAFYRFSHPQVIYSDKDPIVTTAEEAVKVIKSNDRVYIQSVAAAPQMLVNAMTNRAEELRNVEVCHIHTEGEAPYTKPEYADSFINNNFFVGANTRKAVQEGRAGYVPVFLSEISLLFRRNILPIDVALIQVSPPDRHGYCSLGTSVDVTVDAIRAANKVIAVINPNMPRTHGVGLLHMRCADYIVESSDPILEKPRNVISEVEKAIGLQVADLIEDGSTLQMGIGSIPDAVLSALTNHKRLGIHTEMFSDGVMELMEKGVITNQDKKLYANLLVGGFCMGTRKLYDFIHDNPAISMRRIEEINDPANIRLNPKVTAINSAIEIDLTGQICADSIGGNIYSGVGGQMDFMRGAAICEGGKPIIALPSETKKGLSRIVPFLKRGAGVVTTRAHIHWVVTEYGAVNLFGKNIRQRSEALISIAHPRHRPWLEDALRKQYWRDWDSDLWHQRVD